MKHKNLRDITTELVQITQLETTQPLEILGSYLVGALIVDEAGFELAHQHKTLERIAEIGSDLEIKNGSPAALKSLWQEAKLLITDLDSSAKT